MSKFSDDKILNLFAQKFLAWLRLHTATKDQAGMISAEDKDRIDKLWNKYGNVIGDIPDKDKELP